MKYQYYQPDKKFQIEQYQERELFNPFEGLDIFKYGFDCSHESSESQIIEQRGGGDMIKKKSKKINGNISMKGGNPVKTQTTAVRNRQPGISIKKIPGIDIPLQDGRTALHISAEKGQIQATKSLLKAGATVNIYDKQGNSPLHEASQRGYQPIVSLLLEHDAHVNVPNHSGSLPIHLAAINGHENTVRILTGEVSGGAGYIEQDTNTINNTSVNNSSANDVSSNNNNQINDNLSSAHSGSSENSIEKQNKQNKQDQKITDEDNRFENIKEGEERDIMLPGQGGSAPIPGFNLGNLLDAANVAPPSPTGIFASLGKKLLSKTMSFLQPKTPFQ